VQARQGPRSAHGHGHSGDGPSHLSFSGGGVTEADLVAGDATTRTSTFNDIVHEDDDTHVLGQEGVIRGGDIVAREVDTDDLGELIMAPLAVKMSRTSSESVDTGKTQMTLHYYVDDKGELVVTHMEGEMGKVNCGRAEKEKK
jgi:hypothetical protein